MTKQKQEVKNWVSGNLWNLIVTAVLIIIAFVTLQTRVIALELKTNILDEKVAQYPAQEYFDLRFQTIEQGQQDLKEKIQEVKQDVKAHLGE